jgi:hypothetical protein
MMGNYSNRWIVSFTLLATLLLCGCGELAYKRGASASDLDATKKLCMAKVSAKETVLKCMTDNGWVVQNLNSAEPIATMQREGDPVINASVTEDNQQFKSTANNIKINTSDKLEHSHPTNPMDTFKIGSWWKLGADSENLKNSIESCLITLGEAHQPDSQTKKVTRGLLLCMKEKGWHGLRE